jgi:hypothetical protein
MFRVVLAVLTVALVPVLPVLAQQAQHDAVTAPEALKWVEGFAFVPATHPHFAWAGNQETVVQVHGTGPTDITFVNPADDPRKK